MFFEILKKYKNDILLILSLIILSFSAWFIIDTTKTEGNVVIVYMDDKEYGRYSLNKDAEIIIKDGDNYNKLIIKDGTAKIIEASCPKQLCVKSPAITFNNETITCLHHHVIVQIVSDVEPEVDFVS